MGDVIRLRPRHGARPEMSNPAQAGADSNGGATILLFLGVRYERHAETPESAPKRNARRGGRKRA